MISRPFKKVSGQTLIETIIAIPTILAMTVGLLFSFYYSYAFLQIRLALNEGLVCVHNLSVVGSCQALTEKSLKDLLPIGSTKRILFENQKNRIRGSIHFSLTDDISITETHEVNLPIIDWPQDS